MTKDYTIEQLLSIEKELKKLIANHDKWGIKELCKQEEYALHYFVSKAIGDMAKLEHIKNII